MILVLFGIDSIVLDLEFKYDQSLIPRNIEHFPALSTVFIFCLLPTAYKSIKHITHENIKGSYLAYRPLGRAKGYLRGQFQVSLKINLSEM